MSLTQIQQRTMRVNRSELAVPGSNPRFMESASRSDADLVFLDLEDAVAPSEKEPARKQVISALQDLDWTGRTVSVRIMANQIFRPGEAEIKRAKGILSAMEEAQRDGPGAVSYEGKMTDLASLRQAEALVRKANDISAKTL